MTSFALDNDMRDRYWHLSKKFSSMKNVLLINMIEFKFEQQGKATLPTFVKFIGNVKLWTIEEANA